MSSTTGRDRRPGDTYYTPDALAEVLVGVLDLGGDEVIVEPHVGGGAFVRALHRNLHTGRMIGIDIDPSAPGLGYCSESRVADFLAVEPFAADWLVGNPPYGAAEEHIRHALSWGCNVGMLLRLAILESSGRVPLWTDHPASEVYVLAQRPSFTGGKTDSCAYGWFVWRRDWTAPTALRVLSWR